MSIKMRSHGLQTVADLLASDRERIARLFGLSGVRLYDELNEQVVWPIGSRQTDGQKSFMSTRSFAAASSDKRVIIDALSYHVGHVAADMRRANRGCQRLAVLAHPSRHGDWLLHGKSVEVLFDTPVQDTRELMRHATRALETFFDDQVPYKKAGVVVSDLIDMTCTQATLFTEPQAEPDTAVMSLLDGLNERFGRDTITIGRTGAAGDWKPRTDWLSPQYTTRWGDIVSVRA